MCLRPFLLPTSCSLFKTADRLWRELQVCKMCVIDFEMMSAFWDRDDRRKILENTFSLLILCSLFHPNWDLAVIMMKMIGICWRCLDNVDEKGWWNNSCLFNAKARFSLYCTFHLHYLIFELSWLVWRFLCQWIEGSTSFLPNFIIVSSKAYEKRSNSFSTACLSSFERNESNWCSSEMGHEMRWDGGSSWNLS